MNNKDITESANQFVFQRLLARRFSGCPPYSTVEVAGAVITIEPSRHRTGIPSDSRCQRYVVTHVDRGWSLVARAVWDQNGRLHEPTGVHTRIELYLDDGSYETEADICEAVNLWLKALPL